MAVTLYVSLSAAKKDVNKYVWYRVTKGKVVLDSHNKQFDVTLTKGDKFGLKRYSNKFFLIDADNLSVQFSITTEEAAQIVHNSKSFSGTIDGQKVTGGAFEFNSQPGRVASRRTKDGNSDVTKRKSSDTRRKKDETETATKTKRRSSKSQKDQKQSQRKSSHPGLHVEQGNVATQDKQGESDKRVTEKNVVYLLNKRFDLGLAQVKGAPRGVYNGTFKSSPSITNYLRSSGWNVDKERGVVKISLPGSNVWVKLTSRNKSVEVNTRKDNKTGKND